MTVDSDYAAYTDYVAYEWVLDPQPSVADLIRHLNDEARRYGGLGEEWRREEARVNLGLLSCALCCATEDFLAWHPARWPRRLPPLLATAAGCVESGCAILADGGEGDAADWQALRVGLDALARMTLPPALAGWRARIPEAFRCQELSHHDALALAEVFRASHAPGGDPVAVIGLRTAGAYFGPLVAVALARHGISVRGWMTLRPKQGLSAAEARRLRHLTAGPTRVVVVDDHPSTGATFRLTVDLLRGLGLADGAITLLAPDHPAQSDWKPTMRPVEVVTLPYERQFKQALLRDPAAMAVLFDEIHRGQGWEAVIVESSPEVEAVNAHFTSLDGQTFETRAKRLFRLRLVRPGEAPVIRHVLAKGVGWGWLGCHAALAGTRLAGMVPPILAVRQGLLFMEWIGPVRAAAPPPSRSRILAALPAYVAARAERLRLSGDAAAGGGLRRPGWSTLIAVLSRPFGGAILRRLAARRLTARLSGPFHAHATLVDGRMAAEEWVEGSGGPCKVDFEQHNFGGAQPDVVDPAYDLAGAIFELALSAEEAGELIDSYLRLSGDAEIADRMVMNEVLYGVVAMKAAHHGARRHASPAQRELCNLRYNRARDAMTFRMNRLFAARLGATVAPKWAHRLFCLDLDGVFDAELFGPYFPHTTPSGLHALRLLKARGYSVLLNTGRSLEHVRDYCRAYGLPGGLGEYGSVFHDATRGSDISLIPAAATEQLERCREALAGLAGVFLDPGYRHSLRAYRFGDAATIGLQPHEVDRVLRDFPALTAIEREADTTVVAKGVDKGSGLRDVLRLLGEVREPVAAIGDSVQDIPMLREADVAYVPANGHPALRDFARRHGGHLLRQARQRGLLAAISHLLGEPVGAPPDKPAPLLVALLGAAERPPLARLWALLRVRN